MNDEKKPKEQDKAPSLTGLKKLEADLELLANDRAKHQKAVKECSGQRRELQKEFEGTKLLRKKKVDEVLENNFLDQSEKGLIDKVLTTAIKEPRLAQLQDSIAKLEAQEQWHRSRLADISKQEKDIRGQIRKLNEGEALRDFIKAEDNFFQSVLSNDQAWIDLKAAAKHCHSFGMDYQLSFAEHGIVNELIYKILVDVLRPNVVGFKKQMDFLDKMSRMKFLKDNKYFIEPGRTNERRMGERKKIEMRRDNFKP